MKELYVNGKLTLVIYDNDTRIDDGERDIFLNVSDYLKSVIQSNILYDAVDNDNVIEWREK